MAVGGITENGAFLVFLRAVDLSINIDGVALASGNGCSWDFLQLQGLHQATLDISS